MNNPVIPNWMIHCFEDTEHFYGYPVSMSIARNHPLESKINERIQWALEGGLLKKWTSESQSKFKEPIAAHVGPIVLTNEHISIGWMLYLLFLSFACGALIAEQIIYKMAQRPNPTRFWRTMHKWIDGERQYLLPPSGERRVARRRVWELAARCDMYFGSAVSMPDTEDSGDEPTPNIET